LQCHDSFPAAHLHVRREKHSNLQIQFEKSGIPAGHAEHALNTFSDMKHIGKHVKDIVRAMPNWKTGMKPQALYSQETQDD